VSIFLLSPCTEVHNAEVQDEVSEFDGYRFSFSFTLSFTFSFRAGGNQHRAAARAKRPWTALGPGGGLKLLLYPEPQ
jgi:hypothetical protein